MRIRVLLEEGRRDVELLIRDPHATVADLASAVGLPLGPLVVDGHPIRPGQPLDRVGLADGSCVSARGAQPPPPQSGMRVRVTDGFDVGACAPVSLLGALVGRTDATSRTDGHTCVELDDPTVSQEQARLLVGADCRVALGGLAATNQSDLGGRPLAVGDVRPWPLEVEVRCGAAALVLERAPELPLPPRPPAGSATRPLHRTPRPAEPPQPPPVRLPPPPPAPGAVTPVGVLAVLASVAVGAVMVAALHSWMYGLFALLGPVLMVANGLESRRRRRTDRRRSARARGRQLDALDAELAARGHHEILRLEARHPGPGLALDRTAGSAASCWERRPDHVDAFAVRLGSGAAPWVPPVDGPDDPPVDAAAVVDGHRTLLGAALGCRLDACGPIAVVGPRVATLALVRSIVVQVAVDHGPADLAICVTAGSTAADDWSWAEWLPHWTDPHDEQPGSSGRLTLAILDDVDGLAGATGRARSTLRSAADGCVIPVVVVEDAAEVPAACTTVLHVDAQGRMHGPAWLVAPGGTARLMGVGRRTADEVARRLARFHDPELDVRVRPLPGEVGLAELLSLELDAPRAAAVLAARWTAAGSDPPVVAPIGRSADGDVVLDLAHDGPHALVAGTTGAGKSELLRTLVTSLAVGSSPDHLTFVLVDFKGGSAFDACARLPHVTGLVTDLDADLAARALRCLEAEIRRRERALRETHSVDLAHHRRAANGPGAAEHDALPRLVVVVDEFATLAAELPDFVHGLVGIAQRGRSLGVHLVLATQRPGGCVDDDIRANTDVRIALRMQADTDSRDVIDRPDAAALPRRHPGRALGRFGPGDIVAFQAARATGPARTGRRPVEADDLAWATRRHCVERPAPERSSDGGAPTELERIVDLCRSAWDVTGGAAPRCPWPDPLPSEVPLPSAPAAGALLAIGLADDPDHQQQVPFAWDLDAGPLLAIGLAGSGTSTCAATAVLAAARRWRPSEVHIHVIDLGAGSLRPLAALPHVGAVIEGHDLERQRRLVDDLGATLTERSKAGWTDGPRRVVVIDGLTAFRSAWDDLEPTDTWAHFVDLLARGSASGVHLVVTADRPALPHAVLATCGQRLVFRLADRGDHASLGVARPPTTDLPPGRAVAAADGALVQVARSTDLAGTVAAIGEHHCDDDEGGRAAPIEVLPDDITLCRLGDGSRPLAVAGHDGSVGVVVGIADAGLGQVRLELAAGAHALVAGPSRSGRSTALSSIAAACTTAGISVVAVGRPVEGSGGPLALDDPGLLARIDAFDPGDPLVLLVDDADLTADDHAALTALVEDRRPHRHVVASVRADRLRSRYGHWAREVATDRTGLLLQPDADLDGDLLGVQLPRRTPVAWPPGRAWSVGPGTTSIIQVARPDGHGVARAEDNGLT
jgi:S-DNA-T family DNA segregation ATPase FtsK/SpoIIIE